MPGVPRAKTINKSNLTYDCQDCPEGRDRVVKGFATYSGDSQSAQRSKYDFFYKKSIIIVRSMVLARPPGLDGEKIINLKLQCQGFPKSPGIFVMKNMNQSYYVYGCAWT